jgi:hypothetical protein
MISDFLTAESKSVEIFFCVRKIPPGTIELIKSLPVSEKAKFLSGNPGQIFGKNLRNVLFTNGA